MFYQKESLAGRQEMEDFSSFISTTHVAIAFDLDAPSLIPSWINIMEYEYFSNYNHFWGINFKGKQSKILSMYGETC